MNIYEFTVKLNVDCISDDLADRLYKAGCDDTLLWSDSSGVYLSFMRYASSRFKALLSAVRDIERAGYRAANYSADNMFDAKFCCSGGRI